jgi:hypothetical protein
MQNGVSKKEMNVLQIFLMVYQKKRKSFTIMNMISGQIGLEKNPND